MVPESKKLNMGCGYKKLYDHWNVDIEKKCNPDQVLDFEVFPWPYEDNFFEQITADNILSYLGKDPAVFTKIIQEMYRVSKPNAEWFIKFPHHRCDLYWEDYTHVRPLTAKTFELFDQRANFESVARNLNTNTFGLYYDVDLETIDSRVNIVPYWNEQQKNGLIAPVTLEVNLHTMFNVIESVEIFIKVHKPGRYKDWIEAQNRV